mgnify:CR=1 FL=1
MGSVVTKKQVHRPNHQRLRLRSRKLSTERYRRTSAVADSVFWLICQLGARVGSKGSNCLVELPFRKGRQRYGVMYPKIGAKIAWKTHEIGISAIIYTCLRRFRSKCARSADSWHPECASLRDATKCHSFVKAAKTMNVWKLTNTEGEWTIETGRSLRKRYQRSLSFRRTRKWRT